ncbi:glycine cleavage system aminomethyltransferase GcvT [Alkalihalobacillus pseudalcaliphilus]|uniref:glycine cleavage system aminomethyltransferase GcvT n=1 Tax=Alkalihalobacillus pseudalcaliphilus TaxID=79884 RepID=UPI00064D9CE5|nr:glycine cleavage system aminomethyltransferase GcvT [Alkalihalobacillus pseudalcaliphilus]KMK76972.1 glycine cleavage system protein T [Alkalihalobacillus pseudalcaliphilus]
MSELLRTPLYEIYRDYGAKTVDFGGWDLPVQFSSIKEEHEAVRTHAGLFDVSHMGEVLVEGPQALAYIQSIVTNDVSLIEDGQAQYTAMCYEDGGTVDDLLVYRKSETTYLLVINASNINKDLEWMEKHLIEGVQLSNLSDEMSLIALQGPEAESILQKVINEDLSVLKPFNFYEQVQIANGRALISRTGYTGEDGFEIYCDNTYAIAIWQLLLEQGEEKGLIPCGLGARDTLRFEARLALYGQELTKDISPLEAGIGFAVKVQKQANFVGKEALLEQKENGLTRKLVGIEMIDKGIPRTGYEVFAGEEVIGFVTTGTQSPTLKKNVGLAIVDINYAKLDTEIEVQVRKKRLKAKVVKTPFYRRSK